MRRIRLLSGIAPGAVWIVLRIISLGGSIIEHCNRRASTATLLPLVTGRRWDIGYFNL
jgi:hypothetical protein